MRYSIRIACCLITATCGTSMYRGIQLYFTTEIEVSYMLFERCHIRKRKWSLKQHIKRCNFRSKIRLDHPFCYGWITRRSRSLNPSWGWRSWSCRSCAGKTRPTVMSKVSQLFSFAAIICHCQKVIYAQNVQILILVGAEGRKIDDLMPPRPRN